MFVVNVIYERNRFDNLIFFANSNKYRQTNSYANRHTQFVERAYTHIGESAYTHIGEHTNEHIYVNVYAGISTLHQQTVA